MISIPKLPPFKRFCITIGAIPTTYIESLSYYETLLWLCKYLQDTVIPAVNTNAEAVTELQNAFETLQTYVQTYFDNLDVQEEINNKLDDMVESGELQEIISEYLNSIAVFCYDTVNDMKDGNTLQVGSYARTTGYYTKGDKGGALYYITDNDTANDIDKIALNNDLVAVLVKDGYYIKANQVGVHCDMVTDDITQLQAVVNYCKDNDYELLIDGYTYISNSLDTKGISIKGIGERPYPEHTFTSDTYGYLGWDYLRNTGDGANVDFADYTSSMLKKGSGIISDTANPIIKCNTDNGKFRLEDLSIVGWLRTSNQIGIKSTYSSDSDTYINGKHKFKNISVFNCGGDGINLQSLELTHIENVDVSFNFGHGFYIEEISDHDCPFEYVTFDNCRISGNKLGGVYAKDSFRKSVKFNSCLFGRTGLYDQLAIEVPSTLSDIVACITIDGRTSYNNEEQRLLIVDNCYGEEQNLMVKINDYASGRIFNNITIKDCIGYPSSNAPINAIAYIDTYYCRTFNFYNNVLQSLDPTLVFSSNNKVMIPNIVDKVFYQQYTNAPTISPIAKLTVTKSQIYKYSNVIFVNILATANDDIAAYTNLVENLPAPIDTYYPDFNINNNLVRGSFYANGNISIPSAITNGQSVNINLVYFTNYQS